MKDKSSTMMIRSIQDANKMHMSSKQQLHDKLQMPKDTPTKSRKQVKSPNVYIVVTVV